MQRVIHFSGGRTSALMTIMLNPTENDIVLFTDTKREHPDTYKFIEAFEKNEGIKIHKATFTHKNVPGLSGFDALVELKKYLPNRTKRICTVELKINTARRYLRSLGIQSYHSYIGFRFDEPLRVKRHFERWKKVKTIFPLYNARITKEYVNNFWQNKPYNLEIPSILGNCDGCFLKGKSALLRIFAQHPEIAEKWILDESKIPVRGNYDTPATYIKGVTYKQLLELSKQNPFSKKDMEELQPAFSCSCTSL